MTEKQETDRVLFDFIDPSEADLWRAVNDNVMGGVSKGNASPGEDSCLLFSGSISLENNGGFASIRSLITDLNLGDYNGIRIRVKGDGRTYQFRLRTDRNLDGIAFKQEFETIENEWIEAELPFASFVPTYRGRILTDVEPLDPADIRQLGFLLADKKAGPFNLMVDRIVSFK
ncbi:CIA30 family protein [bacterium]|nr:CIA30 family protein [bacterium]